MSDKNIKIRILENNFSMSPCEDAAPYPKEKPVKMANAHQGQEGRMHRTQLAHIISDATMLLDLFEDETDLPEWLEAKITKAGDYLSAAARYLAGEKSRENGRLS
tara:strand:- start:4367 stop:4681 length:315 start_codon:yes stop_codon:yes gene_type:complete